MASEERELKTPSPPICAARTGKSFPGADASVTVQAISIPFGHDRDGSMLSDHLGYVAYLDTVPRTSRS
ncbi:MAG: hypothetical protein KAY22_11125 [Rhizorhabdus sp.]|uniref:hypothetical protein n=1 Tax=Rhizorhabdus sp. TaxID=1968843 RepID=UPI001B5FCD3B|nr:hypothetical protein [Rhizorhabdus sp.]MBP8232846.1 hypothetical protein [Rhizorhabdus sp.]